MPMSIMQDDQFAAAQDFPVESAHRPAWNKHCTVDGLAMAVHVENCWRVVLIPDQAMRIVRRALRQLRFCTGRVRRSLAEPR